jgi:Protein of unknown function (DUF3089)
MTQYGTWLSYSGDARIWLAIGLLAVAGGAALAGIQLPLPVRPARPGPAGRAAMVAAWAASIAALLACVSIYIRQSMHAYDLSAPAATPSDPITPVTLTAAAAIFVIIVIISRGSHAWGTSLASGAIGAIAAPMIFELPFDLIVMPRSRPVIDPGLYRPLLFGSLFAIEITTLLLLRLSPVVRLARATFFSFAVMLGVFAVWALSGFGYPSAPLPTTLNIASKILAFVTALTLFLPQRPAQEQTPRPDSNEEARAASPQPALNSAASAEITGDPQLTGQPARSSVPGVVRPRCRALARGACGVLVLALVTAGCSSAGRPAGAPATTPGQAAGPLWLCQPGQTPDPCAGNPAISAVTASGTVRPAARPSSAAASKFACFYLNPTTSLTQTATGNTSLAVTQLDTYIATEEAAPFSQVCNVWSPMYRSQTFPTVQKGLAGDEKLMNSTFTVAYDSVLPAWQWFLARTGSKPVILIGDSQGAAILIHLISAQLDHQPAVLRRLLVAILVGGNLQVPSGKTIGATFTKVPLCTAATQTGCAIAFSSYSSQPPANSVFGRPGQGTSLQSQETAKAGQQVACVNPAALGGGTADLDPYLLTASQTQTGLKEPVPTPWVTYPGLYSATCQQGGGATWLQITSLAGTSHTRPVVNQDIVPGAPDTGSAWGYHGYEYNLTLGNLLHDVDGEEAAWQPRH